MARRPLFVAEPEGHPVVRTVEVEFEWFPGFAKSQAQKSIASMHSAAAELGLGPVLEISSKSPLELGVRLSAFNLQLSLPDARRCSVESAFQGSKVFRDGGPFVDLYAGPSRAAKKDDRLRNSGPLVAFRFFGTDWPLDPKTAFYDWLYLSALEQNDALAEQALRYRAFSDIAFNPKKSINCQAFSAALFVAASRDASPIAWSNARDAFLERHAAMMAGPPSGPQGSLF